MAIPTQEASGFLSQLNKVEAKIKNQLDKMNVARVGEHKVEVAAKAVEEKAIEVEKKLAEALAIEEQEIKAADEKAYEEGKADIQDQYKKQINLAYNKGYYLIWVAALKKLSVPDNSPLRDLDQLDVSFPHSPIQLKEEVEEEEENEKEEEENKGEDKEEAVGAKSPALNNQVLDLTEDNDDEVSKTSSSTKKGDSSTTDKIIEETLKEIDEEITVEIEAEKTATHSDVLARDPKSNT
ncbi:glucosidase 2 subunit beta-like [Camellia sinensis]|uniref:glucosidase 2 subunit beta-like n=1 Tax=Camellia sinensis TaxID=4442 RepID=UPI001036439C|nr:glucosidase 2 subunit beta-like [Camellia sinensis]